MDTLRTPVASPTAFPGMGAHKALVRRIIRAYPSAIARAYSHVRFEIINCNILALLSLSLAGRRSVLDIGCGFGLLGCYLASRHPELRYTGLDLDSGRIHMAQQAASSLGLGNATFSADDARNLQYRGQFEAVLLVDCLHHIPDDAKLSLLALAKDLLVPGGVLILKEVTTRPWPKLFFTWVLDVLVTRGLDMWYWDEARFTRALAEAGFSPEIYPIKDWLPYPHVLYLCKQAER
jgi:2-polyprenyl-3-methyl-5-hydroxy-6-metoxy-1,4-benzoquinol methylase